MTGPDHYRKAEQLLEQLNDFEADDPALMTVIVEAQVHATLALAAATVPTTAGDGQRGAAVRIAWREVTQ